MRKAVTEALANPAMLAKSAGMAQLFKPLANEPQDFMCSTFAGCSLPPYFPVYWPNIFNFPVNENDVFVATPPKCGTTWVQHIAFLVMTEDFEAAATIPVHERSPFLEFPIHIPAPPEMINLPAMLPSPRLMKTHLPPQLLPRDIGKAKVIFVYRNAKDVVVSFYHHSKSLKLGPYGNYLGSFEEFATAFMKGQSIYQPYGRMVSDYFKLKESGKVPNILILRYEDMKSDLRKAIKQIATFLGKDLSEETAERIYNEATFEGMHKNNAANNNDAEALGIWAGSKFMRKGIVGDWRSHFTDEKLVEEFDRHIKETIPPELYHILE